MTARKQAVCAEGTAEVCVSPSEERDGHGSTTRRRGRAGAAVVVMVAVVLGAVARTPLAVEDVALVLLLDGALIDECAEPPHPARLPTPEPRHPITAMTAVRRIRLA